MWRLSAPWWEFILRGVVVYFFLLLLLRLTGKRQVGQLAPFDLVLLLILSNAVENAMSAGDNSMLAGLILATTLIVVNHLVGLVIYRNRKLERWIEGEPQVLIHNGRLSRKVLKEQLITDQELKSALRSAGCEDVKDVSLAILESTGHVSVIAKEARK